MSAIARSPDARPDPPAAGWREYALAAVAVLVTLYGAEVALTPRLGTERIRHDGFLTKLHVTSALRARGVDAYPAVYPFLFRAPHELILDGRPALPLGGIADATTVFCNEGNQIVVYRSDERGFNNPPGLWTPSIDLLLVGDSFTHGECVTTEQGIGGQLRRRWPRTVSLGMGGNGPLTELGGVVEFRPALAPRVLLWVYYEGNDLLDLRREMSDPILRRYLDPGFSQGLDAVAREVDGALRAYVAREAPPSPPRLDNLMSVLKLRNIRRLVRAAFAGLRQSHDMASLPPDATSERPPAPGEEDYAHLEQVLERAGREMGGPRRVVFVYLPAWERYGRPGTADPGRRRILDAVRRLGIRSVDVDAAFLERGDPESLFMVTRDTPGHYTPEGYRIVAAAIRRELERQP